MTATLLITAPGDPPTYVPLADFLLDNDGDAEVCAAVRALTVGGPAATFGGGAAPRVVVARVS
jgi:hypothetical protein